MEIRIIKGPPVARMSRTAAEKKLQEHPAMKDVESFELRDVEGTWVAAVVLSKEASKHSAPPPFAPPEEAPVDGPPTDGPPSEEGPPEEGPPADEGDEEKPKGEEKGEGKKGLEHQVEALTHMLTKLMDALGLSDPAGPEGPMGHEGDPSAPPMEGAPDTAGSDGKTHTVHERALKPGEAPPGTLPVGSPTFASVQPNHPWKDYVGVKRSFTLEEPIGDRTMASVRDELNTIAKGTGYSIKRAKEGLRDGVRVARVIVQADTPVS